MDLGPLRQECSSVEATDEQRFDSCEMGENILDGRFGIHRYKKQLTADSRSQWAFLLEYFK
jgi:hypothetical protein